jgi:hypothetical protein
MNWILKNKNLRIRIFGKVRGKREKEKKENRKQ